MEVATFLSVSETDTVVTRNSIFIIFQGSLASSVTDFAASWMLKCHFLRICLSLTVAAGYTCEIKKK